MIKKILYIVALLVTAGAAFFSWDVHRKFTEERRWIEEAYVDPKTEETFDTGLKGLNARLQASIEETNKDLKGERSQLEDATQLRDDRTAELEVAQGRERTLQRSLTELDGQIEEQKQKLDELDRSVKQVEEMLGGQGVTLEELPQRIAEIRENKKNLTDQLSELESLVDGAKKNLERNHSEVARLGKRRAARDRRIGRNTMEAVITGVNHDWGFVIVGAGSSSGFTPQSTVLVKRDGRVIGRLNPSSIEPKQTIFEIDLDSLVPGVRLRPGDRVILSRPRT